MSGIIKNICNWFLDNFFWIEPNIKELTNNSNKHKVIVQYNPPKWLSPSEVWMIYYRIYKASNINCLIYKWASEWIISFKDKGYRGRIRIIKELSNSVPKYELSYWNGLSKYKHVQVGNNIYEIKDPDNLLLGSYRIQDELLDYCIEKWWLKRTGHNSNIKKLPLIPIIILSLVILYSVIVPIINSSLDSDLLNKSLFFSKLFCWLFGIRLIYVKGWELQSPMDIELTEEWEKLFVEIYWYKYFLEHCDEEMLKKLIVEDPDYINKTLPYAVALRLNARFLKYSLSNFSISSLDVINLVNSKDSDQNSNSNFTSKKIIE